MNKKPAVLAFLASAVLAPYAMAADYPTQAYDARYDMTDVRGKSELRMASDGAGKFLSQSTVNGGKYTTLIDYKSNSSTTLIEQSKMAVQGKLTSGINYNSDENSVKKAGGKLIGTKVISGHPCHGYTYTKDGANTEVWVGDDVKIMVQSTTTTPQGKVSMVLKSLAGSPPVDAFKVPAGYKVMSQ